MSSDGDLQGNEPIRCDLPDNIVGIGHGGKTIVGHYLSKDWIVQEGVEARRDDDNPDGFDAYIIDTAVEDQKEDEARVEQFNERIRRIAEQSGRPPEIVNTDVTYINPLDHAPDDLVSRAGLSSEATVGRIAEHANIEAWWLENNEQMLTDNYEQGVLRRRGLSKALLHASQTGGGPMDDLPLQLDGSTTIVVGLGGGTGSGMFLDLAKQITEQGDNRMVNLVATIPDIEEKDRKAANAFAALSELEYLALNEKNPFTNIVLLPFGPARDLRDRQTFLDGAVQTIVARENPSNNFINFLDESSATDPPRGFAPFTIAVPQILRYDVGDIIETANAIEEFRAEKRAALDAELALYRELHEFVIEEWDGEMADGLETARGEGQVQNEQFTLSSTEANSLRNRLADLEAWVGDEETFGHVDNSALSDWRKRLDTWIDGVEDTAGDLSEKEFKKYLVNTLPERVETLDEPEDEYPGEEAEFELDHLIRDELRAIKLRSNLLRAVKIAREEEVQEALRAALEIDRDAWAGTKRLKDVISRLDGQVSEYEANLEHLSELEDELATVRDHNVEAWRDDVTDDVEQLVALDAHADEIETLFKDLEGQLGDAFRTINNASDPDEVPQNLISFDFARLNEQLRAVDLEPVDGDAIKRTVSRTADAYDAWYEINNGGFFSSIFGGKEEAKERYKDYQTEIDTRYVTVTPTGERDNFDRDFKCEFVADGIFDDTIERLGEKRDHHHDAVVRRLRDSLSQFEATELVDEYRAQWVGDDFQADWPGETEDAVEELRDYLAGGLDARSAEELLDDLTEETGYPDPGLVHEAFQEAYLGPVEAERERIESVTEDLGARMDLYARLREIVTDYGESFETTGPTRPEVDDVATPQTKSASPYVKTTQSQDRGGLREYDDIADAGVWSGTNSDEMRKIRAHFSGFAKTIGDNSDLLDLAERRIRIDNRSGEYKDVTNPHFDGHYVGNVFLGRPFDTDESPSHPAFDAVKETLEDSDFYFREGANGYSQEAVGFGAPWDLSMITFIGGVFLDNIAAIRQPSKGYKNTYERQRDQLKESVRIRHVHGVDGRDDTLGDEGEGGYVYRQSLLDFNDPDDLYTLLNATEGEMIETLLDEYVGRTTFQSSIDLTDGE
ncbi:tubulin-like doman-containing protein [Halobellus ordinarius]|uniref:tubulin-like doman-containing protein n=1 Tax=Halobellus ordinarius TaxID=3075120 RepID=UPI0028801B20|nr:tubulin-like doman-containing protein [Halobellus sp. ZY16]